MPRVSPSFHSQIYNGYPLFFQSLVAIKAMNEGKRPKKFRHTAS